MGKALVDGGRDDTRRDENYTDVFLTNYQIPVIEINIRLMQTICCCRHQLELCFCRFPNVVASLS